MIKLLIIADDFTGALDTGIQFVDSGVATQIVTDDKYDFVNAPGDVEVLVVNAETRHVPPKQAYETIRQIVYNAKQAGIIHFYKKTDSTLRGNIGSELQAVMDATGQKRLHFIPALPAMGRVTAKGVQYVNEIPVAESTFGKDPFSPVKYSKIEDIIAIQTDTSVINHPDYEVDKRNGIHIYDAATDTDLIDIAYRLKAENELTLIAGCAGFASVMPELFDLVGCLQQDYSLPPSMLVVCGSVNPVTLAQLKDAVDSGFARFSLTPPQKLDPEWLQGSECQKLMGNWLKTLKDTGRFILDANDTAIGETQVYAGNLGISTEELRVGISTVLGTLLKMMLDQGVHSTLFLTGGDTLLAFMRQINARQLTPICEMAPGVVLSWVLYKGKEYPVISKSGGLGNGTVISDLARIICLERKEEDKLC